MELVLIQQYGKYARARGDGPRARRAGRGGDTDHYGEDGLGATRTVARSFRRNASMRVAAGPRRSAAPWHLELGLWLCLV